MTYMREDCQLIRISLSNRRLTAPLVSSELLQANGANSSISTVKRRLQEVELFGCVGSHALQLRITFAASHLHRTTETGQLTIGHA